MMKLDIIDDYTFKLTFDVPNPSFTLVNMAHRYGFGQGHFVPAHYLKQFHIKYNDQADELATAAGFDFWYQLHGRENDRGQSLDRSRLESHIPVQDTPSMSFWERNPYYHAVDPEGNQLPYVDALTHDKCADLSILDAKTVGGQYDFACYELRILFYATYAEGGNIETRAWASPGKGGRCVYNVNAGWHTDEDWREVFSGLMAPPGTLAGDQCQRDQRHDAGNAAERSTVIPPRATIDRSMRLYAEYSRSCNALLDRARLVGRGLSAPAVAPEQDAHQDRWDGGNRDARASPEEETRFGAALEW